MRQQKMTNRTYHIIVYMLTQKIRESRAKMTKAAEVKDWDSCDDYSDEIDTLTEVLADFSANANRKKA